MTFTVLIKPQFRGKIHHRNRFDCRSRGPDRQWDQRD